MTRESLLRRIVVTGGLCAGLTGVMLATDSAPALACGCLAPPDPSVPVVQAGERIVFAVDNSVVTATIQLQYSGNAKDFGWILPLPSIPTMELGSDELFAQVQTLTQPKYRLTRVFADHCNQGTSAFARGAVPGAANAADSGGSAAPQSPLVVQDSIGPYDYAVLKADDKQAMLNWLAQNHYFVPAGTAGTLNSNIVDESDSSHGPEMILVSFRALLPLPEVSVRYAVTAWGAHVPSGFA